MWNFLLVLSKCKGRNVRLREQFLIREKPALPNVPFYIHKSLCTSMSAYGMRTEARSGH